MQSESVPSTRTAGGVAAVGASDSNTCAPHQSKLVQSSEAASSVALLLEPPAHACTCLYMLDVSACTNSIRDMCVCVDVFDVAR